jgi:hypothetical protein
MMDFINRIITKDLSIITKMEEMIIIRMAEETVTKAIKSNCFADLSILEIATKLVIMDHLMKKENQVSEEDPQQVKMNTQKTITLIKFRINKSIYNTKMNR